MNIKAPIVPEGKNSELKNTHISSPWLKFLQRIETLCTEQPLFRKWYSSLFYKSMTEKEIKAADIAKGSRILHIGCGPMPFTAEVLARWGAQVTAVDIDPLSASRAQRLFASLGLSSQITVKTGNGLDDDPSKYDGIWISLHVSPKETLTAHLLSEMKPGAVLVVRNPRSWLRVFYPSTPDAENQHQVRQRLGKVSTVIMKCRGIQKGENSPLFSTARIKLHDTSTGEAWMHAPYTSMHRGSSTHVRNP